MSTHRTDSRASPQDLLQENPVIQNSDEEKTPRSGDEVEREYMTGWRFYILSVALCLILFLTSLEISIVATSLVSMANDFNEFNHYSWVITAYLLTYTAFLIISAKLSDIFGRKSCVIVFFVGFSVFSGGCGAAQNMTQLIVLRAFQGIGAAGSNAVTLAIFFELVPPAKYATNTSVVALAYALSQVLGPLLGGAISDHSTWRWVFLLNVPAGFVSLIVLILSLPARYPFHYLPKTVHQPLTLREKFPTKQLKRIDFLGTGSLLLSNVFLVAALEEANTEYAWNSAFVIIALIISGLSWVTFLTWSWWIYHRNSPRESVFPWRFIQNRVCFGLILLAIITGAPFTIALIDLPLRFQSVNGASPWQAGIKLLPFIGTVPLGAMIASVVMGKPKAPPIHVTFVGSAIQLVGFVLLSRAPNSAELPSSFYGFEAIAGFGLGITYATVTILAPFVAEKRDLAVATSGIVQFRLIGGVIGLAIVTTVLNGYVRSHLAQFLSQDEISELLRNTGTFHNAQGTSADTIQSILAAAFNLQMRVVIGISAAQIPATLLLWRKPQIIIV